MTNPDCFMPFGQASSSSISSGFWSQSTIFEGPELQTIPGGTPAFSTPFEQYDLLMQVQPWSLHANFLYPMALASSSSRNNRPTQPISQKSDHPEPAVDGSSLIKCPDCVATFKRIQEWKRHARYVLSPTSPITHIPGYIPRTTSNARIVIESLQEKMHWLDMSRTRSVRDESGRRTATRTRSINLYSFISV